MQTARLFLISSSPLSLCNVPGHVCAELRLTAKMATRPLASGLLLVAKISTQPVTTSMSAGFLFAPARTSLLFLRPISPAAP
jgi:hypothetical protein